MADSVTMSRRGGNFLQSITARLFAPGENAATFQADGGADTHTAPYLAPANRLFDVYDHSSSLCYADSLYGNTVLVVDPRNRSLDVRHWLASNCLPTCSLGDLAQAGGVIESGIHQVGLVVVDVDSCGGIAKVIGELMAFRKKFVDIPLVLVSAESPADDFSTERLAIADVTLHVPVSVSRLDLALAEAQINNQAWQARNPPALQ